MPLAVTTLDVVTQRPPVQRPTPSLSDHVSVPAAHQLRTHLRVRSRTNWAMPTSSYGSAAQSASASAGTPGSPKPVQHTQARHLAPDPAAERGFHATARPPHVVTCFHEFVQ